MARHFTYAHVNGPAGLYEGDVYRGTANSAADYNVVRWKDRDSTVEAHQSRETNEFIDIGWRMHRKVTAQLDDGTPSEWEPWKPVHPQGEPGVTPGVSEWYAKTLCNPTNEVSVNPGQNMKDPDGLVIFAPLTVGAEPTVVPQPASGEQARDPWTGDLLFEEDGTTPILEP